MKICWYAFLFSKCECGHVSCDAHLTIIALSWDYGVPCLTKGKRMPGAFSSLAAWAVRPCSVAACGWVRPFRPVGGFACFRPLCGGFFGELHALRRTLAHDCSFWTEVSCCGVLIPSRLSAGGLLCFSPEDLDVPASAFLFSNFVSALACDGSIIALCCDSSKHAACRQQYQRKRGEAPLLIPRQDAGNNNPAWPPSQSRGRRTHPTAGRPERPAMEPPVSP